MARGQTARGTGFVVLLDGKMMVGTAAPTIIGAKVNAMKELCYRQFLKNDDGIEPFWDAWSEGRGLTIEPVLITLEAEHMPKRRPRSRS